MKRKQQGSGAISAILLIAVIGLVVGVGIYVWRFRTKDNRNVVINSTTTQKQPGDYDPYNFSITPPTSWTKTSPPAGLVSVYHAPAPDKGLNQPATSDNDPGFYAPAIYIGHDYDQNTLDEDVQANTDPSNGYPKHLANYKDLGSSRITVSGLPAELMYFSYVKYGQPITAYELIVVHAQQGYQITGASASATWPQNQAAIKASLLSFRLK